LVESTLNNDDARFVELQHLLDNDGRQPSIYSPQPHGVRGAGGVRVCENGPRLACCRASAQPRRADAPRRRRRGRSGCRCCARARARACRASCQTRSARVQCAPSAACSRRSGACGVPWTTRSSSGATTKSARAAAPRRAALPPGLPREGAARVACARARGGF
jgi:hypothetical protein